MNTSYFAINSQHPNAVSIAVSSPDYYRGREYRKLAPPTWLLNLYKRNHSESTYIQRYTELILDKLNPQEVYDELGEDAVLLCWEKSNTFCHRHLVARWIEKALGVEVPELCENTTNTSSRKITTTE